MDVRDIRKLEFEVEPGLGRIRLDDYLFARLTTLSRMYLRELVKENRVLLNGEFTNVGVRLRANDFLEIEADMSRGTAMRAENLPLDIILEDESIIVVNKPAGMLVHPTHRDKNGTLLNALAFYLNAIDVAQSYKDAKEAKFVRPGLIHRLDRETSGLIVIAKTVDVHRRLAREFMKKRVEKRYVALVEGVVEPETGTIELPIGRFADRKLWDVKHDGKHSITRFSVMHRGEDTTLVELEPVTGRTNQLRIHCASFGHPIVGDAQRGGRYADRLYLHANAIKFRHPMSGETVDLNLPIPINFHTTAE